MERIGEIIKYQPSSTGEHMTTNSPSQQQQAHPWMKLLGIIAQDRRHDLAPAIVGLWKEKLEKYDDDEICDALKLYSGEFFPTIEAIVGLVERRRKNAATNAPWDKYKSDQQYAAEHGLLASTEDYEWLRERFKAVATGPKLVGKKGDVERNRPANKTA